MKYVRIIDSKGSAVAEIRIPDEYDVVISTTSMESVINTETMQEAIKKTSSTLSQTAPQIQPVQEVGKQQKESVAMNVDHEREAIEAVKEMRSEIESSTGDILESLLPSESNNQAEKTPANIDEYMQKEIANVEMMARTMEKKMKSPEEQKKAEAIESIIDEILEFNPEVK